jgi:isopenicillin-N N-acyltransferase like protein
LSQFQKPINELPVIELEGSCREMGQQFGESCKQQCQELYRIRMNDALKHAAQRGRNFTEQEALTLAGSSVSLIREFDQDQHEETLGIAQGANLSLEQVYILQGLTDFRDYLSWGKIPDGFGCTSLIVSPQRSDQKKLLLAQNWDLGTTNMSYVCFVKRKPKNAPQTMSLTVTGGLCLVALNSEGVAIGTTNIKTTDSRPGIHYLNIIHRAMKCRSTSEAQELIQTSVRSGAHYYMLGDKAGDFAGLECSALKHAVMKPTNGIVTHCNHIINEDLKALEAEDMGASTQHRQKRIDELMSSGSFNIENLKKFLADPDGGNLAICRYDCDGYISTNGSVIISPETGEIQACRSQPDIGKWEKFTF